MATGKLDIKRELAAVDLKNHEFFSGLTDEEKKAFSPFVLMRFISNAQGSRDIQEWFIEMTNESVNKHHWVLSKNHKELLWQLCATTGIGTKMFHPYLAASKKDKASKVERLIASMYPAMKYDEVEMLANSLTKSDLNELFDSLGFDDKQRKEYE